LAQGIYRIRKRLAETLMLRPGDVVSYLEMCAPFGVNLQRGMNFRLTGNESLILMSVRPSAPYKDRVEQGGKVIVYEGHDVPRSRFGPDPKRVDQPEFQPNGKATQNGLFTAAVRRYKAGQSAPERVRVFEKIRDGIWVYNGLFSLIDGWREEVEGRKVFKFKLQVLDEPDSESMPASAGPGHDRVIPTAVKLEVWKRDKGSCVKCGSKKNLHFDHIIPYSQGGSSKDPENIQILCAAHNIGKRDRIE
jgi:HNH endonuclease